MPFASAKYCIISCAFVAHSCLRPSLITHRRLLSFGNLLISARIFLKCSFYNCYRSFMLPFDSTLGQDGKFFCRYSAEGNRSFAEIGLTYSSDSSQTYCLESCVLNYCLFHLEFFWRYIVRLLPKSNRPLFYKLLRSRCGWAECASSRPLREAPHKFSE